MSKFVRFLLLASLTASVGAASAHVDWTTLNHPGGGGAYAIYHFDETGVLANASSINREGSLPAGTYPLVIANNTVGLETGSVTGSTDTFDVGIPADTGSLIFSGPTVAASPAAAAY
ncbi:MAG: hypothetical protein ABI579_03500 [Candidatus Sumerlaeota bacterium]